MKQKNNKGFVRFILHFVGLSACIVPPILCTLSYFPLWLDGGGEQLICGGTALLLIISVIPFYKYIRKLLESAASYVLWLIIFLFCFLMSKVIDEITVISFVGFIGNVLGASLMSISDKIKN